jgi:hypothetical protein
VWASQSGALEQTLASVLADGRTAWCMSADGCVKEAMVTAKRLHAEGSKGGALKKQKAPLPNLCKPELDVSEELTLEAGSRHLQLIGTLRWAIELGCIDILQKVSVLSHRSASPRVGHLEAVCHVFGCLSAHSKSKLVLDPASPKPEMDESAFQHEVDWVPFCGDAEEELPPKTPKPRGKKVSTHCFVDANHAGNAVAHRSHTGILIFVNRALAWWFSEKQNTVESSTFGSESVASRIATEQIKALRHKLRMFGVPVDGPADVFCDNQGMVKNASIPESALSKKHNSTNCNLV